MRLALAQVNPTIGDLPGNAALIARWIDAARAERADLVVFPELCLTGYPPRDLLLQEGFIADAAAAAKGVGEGNSVDITVVFGVPLPLSSETGAANSRPGIANSLLAYRDGELLAYYDKRLLPTYDVFDEDRYFVAGGATSLIDVAGVGVGLTICEDLWRGEDVGFSDRYAAAPDPVAELVRARSPAGNPPLVIINPSASPFVLGKGRRHREILRRHAAQHRVWMAGVNQVGGNDELVFDGHAAVVAPDGALAAAGPGFEEALTLFDIDPAHASPSRAIPDPLLTAADESLLYRALVLGVRDYCRKTGFASAVLGLSGGIDSAVTAVIATAALGAGSVQGVSMPGPFSSGGSRTDAAAMASGLGLSLLTVPIGGPFGALRSALAPAFAGRPEGVTEENLQSRVRGTILMALSNKFGHIVLTTGNKSELAVGYCTLYGDMNGGLAVLCDVSKQWVYRLARWMNSHPRELGIPGLSAPPIPESTIHKPPSAELRPNQTDQDHLPGYDVLDEIIERYIEKRQHPRRIADEAGIDASTVARIVRMIDTSEYKRKQAATGLKVTSVAFGIGRRVPIAQRWRPELGLM